jgi:prolyl 4-hydroxylase
MMIVLVLLSVLLLAFLLRPRYHEPKIIKDMVSPEECDYIKDKASKNLQPSVVSREKVVNDDVRISETAWLGKEDPVVRDIMERCLTMTDRPIENCEKLQVLRYKPGGFYKPHQDCFKEDKNRRMHTCIIALTDDYEGGATVFPNLKKEYRLKKGDALFFDTLNDWGHMTPKALHGGAPVTAGEKWICNLWIRTYPYDA